MGRTVSDVRYTVDPDNHRDEGVVVKPTVEIGPDGPRGDGGAHIGTVFRFKGLEYQRMVIAGVSEGLAPRTSVIRLRGTGALRHRRELQRARSLLFVAATRPRDALAISWHGTPSRFPEPLPDG